MKLLPSLSSLPLCWGLLNGLLYAQAPADTAKINREYHLEATMLGYFSPDGAKNPTLRASKGERVRIIITNAEMMTHDIVMEKMGVKSKPINNKGETTSITFIAQQNDTYFCSVPGHRLAGMVGKLEVVKGPVKEAVVQGIVPKKNGVALNLNFESGTLKDWKATGEAYRVLTAGDSSQWHEKGMKLGAEGKYALTSGGTVKATLTGTLTSVPFKVTHPFAAFKVSGGALQDTRVEVLLAQSNSVIFSITGQGRATLQPVVVDLRAYLGKEIYIKVVDNESGMSQIPYIPHDKWAHINFDDFRFYPQRPNFPNELKQSDIVILPPLDPVLHAGLSGIEAAKAMTPPTGFKITLAAAEPDIVRPICFTIDFKGRLWVVEGHTYPIPAPEGQGRDRILILEDTNGDGTLDSRKIFMEGLNLVSGIEVGMGGVWLGAAPYLLFIPADFQTDTPTGPIQKRLDGWGVQDTHETLNSLRWGPDGWLYGTHGVFTHSNVGKPGAPNEERTKFNAGVWRYHPTKQLFEVFSEGTSNPWGIDFDDYGQAFITACVIPHLYHTIQGARYQRQAGKHFNPYTYDDIKTIADHVHWVGDRGPHAGNFRSAAKGGGHAHAGAMIYLGHTWPKEYRNELFMNNINGSRFNIDHLQRAGSGYVGQHRPDFMAMNDAWSQWLNFKYDASGSVFAIDWYDKNQCHSNNPDVHDKTMGRIFKITHQNDQWTKIDLTTATDLALVNYQLHPNEWYVRWSRVLLQERGGSPEVHQALKNMLQNQTDHTRQLRALWTLYATKGLNESELQGLLLHQNEYVRSWAIQFLAEGKQVGPETLRRLEALAQSDPSPVVRLYLTSAMIRLPLEQRWGVLEALSQKTEDKTDHNLPLMLWYAAEPLAAADAKRALQWAEKSVIASHLPFMVRRVMALETPEAKAALGELRSRMAHSHAHAHAHDVLMLIDEGSKK